MSASLSTLQPDLYPWANALVTAAGQAGLMPRVTSTRRSYADQVRLYRRAQAGLSPYPANRPGTSSHEYGWAFDMVVSPLSALADVGDLWESWGGVWGGRPRRAGSGYDPVHFEYPNWRNYVDFNSPDLRQQQEDQDSLFRQVFGPAQQSTGEILGRVARLVQDVPVPTSLGVQAVVDLVAELFGP